MVKVKYLSAVLAVVILLSIIPAEAKSLKGKRYKAVVPDTLDLADRADFAINGLTGQIVRVAKDDYELFWTVNYTPPRLGIHACQWTDVCPRGLESLCGLRAITGSDYNIELEENLLKSMLSRIGDDGLLYNAPFRIEAPWRYGGIGRGPIDHTKGDYSLMWGSADLLVALVYRYQRDGDPVILEKAKGLAKGLVRTAIDKGDYAYYPATHKSSSMEFCYYKDGGWADTDEAKDDHANAEGSLAGYFGMVIKALSEYYQISGDEEVLEMAGKLSNYVMKPRFWTGGYAEWSPKAKALIYQGCHGGAVRRPTAMHQTHQAIVAYALSGLASYAEVSGDVKVREFVREGYEHFRTYCLAPIGRWGENVTNTIPVMIAIKLSDCGVGDYWDDVDRYVRNTLAEDQFIDADLLREACKIKGRPTESTYDISRRAAKRLGWSEEKISKIPPNPHTFTIEKLLGLTRHGGNRDPWGTMDPTQNFTGASSYHEPYYCAWEAITRYKDGVGHINLLLNRASAWLDIDSHLPYEGKVVIRNKKCKAMTIRIPGWVDKNKISCRIAQKNGKKGKSAEFYWTGNYITLRDNLKGKEVITIEFPMAEYTETYYLVGLGLAYDKLKDVDPLKWYEKKDVLPKYIMEFKGNTCIKLDFPRWREFGYPKMGEEKPALKQGPKIYPVYQREHYRADKAPMKKTQRYITPKIIKW